MNEDIISRQAAIDEIEKYFAGLPIQGRYDMLELVKALPSAQPEQIVAKQILWMEIKEKPDFISYTPHCKCSNCGHELILENINYCYACGARFVGKEKRDG